MSSGMTFLLWLAWVAGCTGLVVLLVILSKNLYLRRMQSLVRTLRCPDCGGEYDGTTISPMGHGHPLIPPAPHPVWRVSCAACRIVAVYTEQGQLQRTYGPDVPLPGTA